MSRDVEIGLGLAIIAAVSWLAFANWHAAVIVLLVLILSRMPNYRP